MKLKICQDFFNALNYSGIRYCHWKSNIRLEKSLSGKTDLDILIHKTDKDVFNKYLKKFLFKKIVSPPQKQYPDIEDYLGFDYETGALIHLHVHYSLILGQRYIKNHHLTVEGIYLKNLMLQDNINIPVPELELITLIIRAHMKIDLLSFIKQIIKDFQGLPYTPFTDDLEEELDYLINKCDINKIKTILNESQLHLSWKVFDKFMNKYSDKNLKSYDIARTFIYIFKALEGYRRIKSKKIYLEYLYRAFLDLYFIRKLLPGGGKMLPEKGKLIAFIGVDGSGKSTIVKDISKWLSWKLSVKNIYFGIPKTRRIDLIIRVNNILNKLRLVHLVSIIEALLWVYIAKQRYKISLYADKIVKRGKVVISDRFPLKNFNTMKEPMDGPRLMNNRTWVGSSLSSLENGFYHRIMEPDIILVLKVGLDEVRKRKTDLDLETHRLKVEAVNLIQPTDIIKIIDANRPYEDVLLEAKRIIWNAI
jgi:thymidylate kinase